MIKRIGDFMAWLGGADPAILAKAPRERARLVQMAGVLLTTAGIATLAMIFALHDGVKVPLFPALVLGLCWGVIILNLDRFLVLSMGTTRDRWKLVLMAVPRLALAAVLSLVISTPLVLRVFASDISAQLYTMRLENSRQQAQLEAHSKEQRQLNHVQAQIKTDNAVLAGHIAAVSSPQLQTAQAQVAKLQPQAQSDFRTANRDYEAWQCELTGQHCVGSSGRSGNGPRAQAKQQAYLQAKATYNSVEAQLNQAQAAEQAAQAGRRPAPAGRPGPGPAAGTAGPAEAVPAAQRAPGVHPGRDRARDQSQPGRYRHPRPASSAVGGQRTKPQPQRRTPGGPGGVLPHRDPPGHSQNPAQPVAPVRVRNRRQGQGR